MAIHSNAITYPTLFIYTNVTQSQSEALQYLHKGKGKRTIHLDLRTSLT